LEKVLKLLILSCGREEEEEVGRGERKKTVWVIVLD